MIWSNNMLEKRRNKGMSVATRPKDDDGIARMEFLLTLRRRGIGDAAVLRGPEGSFTIDATDLSMLCPVTVDR